MFSLASKHNDPNASLAWSERIQEEMDLKKVY